MARAGLGLVTTLGAGAGFAQAPTAPREARTDALGRRVGTGGAPARQINGVFQTDMNVKQTRTGFITSAAR